MSLEGITSSLKQLKGSIHGFNVYHTDAYAIAVRNGFEGTEAEWLASLKGEKGEKGDPGVVDENGFTLKDQTTGTKYTLYVSDGKLTMESEV